MPIGRIALLSSGDGGIAKILGMDLELLGDPPQAGF
jgi:hypothetical protein